MADDRQRKSSPDASSMFAGARDNFVGTTIGDYEVVEKIADGNLSSVYQAVDVNTGQTAVLKVVHKHLLAGMKSQKRVEQKLSALTALQDDAICSYEDFAFIDGRLILVMAPVVYESLEDLLSKTGHLGPERAVGIFIQTCQALAAALKSDISHRDLKPSNIMILDNQKFSDDVMVMDFGMAKLIAEEGGDKSDQYMTRSRESLGTPLYQSPEQCAGKRVDHRSDIYSLGCIIYEALTGKPPFVGKNVLETAYKHMNDMPRALNLDASLEPVSTRFQEVVSKCLAKDPNKRYQTPEALQNDLELLMAASDVEWNNSAYVHRAAEQIHRGKRSGPSVEKIIWAAVIVIFTGVVGFWGWFIFKPEGTHKYPPFDNEKLWIVNNVGKATPVEDFGNKEESDKLTLQNIERDMGTNCREYADALLVLVQLYFDCKHWSDAEIYSKKLATVTEKLEKDGQEGPGPLSECLRMVAYAAFCNNNYADAIKAAQRSVELASGKETLNVSTMQCLRILGDIYTRQKNLRSCLEVYNQFYALADQDKEQHPQVYWEATAKFADTYRRLGDLGEADRFYRMGLDWWRSHGQPDNGWASRALYGHALVLNAQNKSKECEEELKDALNLQRRLPQPDLALTGAVRKLYMDTLWRNNPMGAVSAQFSELDVKRK